MNLREKRRYWFTYLANKMGDQALSEKLGYKDNNFLNQVKNGHKPIGNQNAERFCAALGVHSGWFDRQPPGEGRDNEIYELAKDATEEQTIAAMRSIAQIVSPPVALAIARVFLDRASSPDEGQS